MAIRHVPAALPLVAVRRYRGRHREMACLPRKTNRRKADDAYPPRLPVRDALAGRLAARAAPGMRFRRVAPAEVGMGIPFCNSESRRSACRVAGRFRAPAPPRAGA
jgi:hypothetical protein